MTTALLIINGLAVSYKGDPAINSGSITVTDISTGEEEVIHSSHESCANFIARSLGATDVDCEEVAEQLPDNLIPWLEEIEDED